MLSIQNLKVSFQDFSLSASSLELPTKGVVLLNGDNGAGKSTLLRCITGFNRSHEGQLFFHDTLLNPLSQIARVPFISYLPQHNGTLPNISGQEFIEEGLYLQGENQLESLIQNLPVSQLLTKNCATLSGGEKQLLCFIRNLALKKPLIILDEPEVSLSKSNRNILAQVISQLDGLIIIASHHPELYSPVAILDFVEEDDYKFIINKTSP